MKRTNFSGLVLPLLALWLAMVATACGSAPAAPTPPTLTATIAVATPVPTPAAAEDTTATVPLEGDKVAAVEDLAAAVAQRTPVPTPTADPVEQLVEQIADRSGLSGRSFLGLSSTDWLNVGVSVLVIALGSLLVIRVLTSVLRWAVRRTETTFDDDLLHAVGRELKWLVVFWLSRWATLRLVLWSEAQRGTLEDVFFVLIWCVAFAGALRMVDFAVQWYEKARVQERDQQRMDPVLLVFRRLAQLLLAMIALSLLLSHFGISATLVSATILMLVIIIAVAGRAATSDVVSGFLILIDPPFRVGDIIYFRDMETWARVEDIGIRVTRVRAGDGPKVIVPNSLIGQSLIVNYSHPDPALRVKSDVDLSYEADLDQVRQTISEAVRGVEGVLPDKPVDVLFDAFEGSQRKIRVRWWIEVGAVKREKRMRDRVNAAIERALAGAGIDMPTTTYHIQSTDL